MNAKLKILFSYFLLIVCIFTALPLNAYAMEDMESVVQHIQSQSAYINKWESSYNEHWEIFDGVSVKGDLSSNLINTINKFKETALYVKNEYYEIGVDIQEDVYNSSWQKAFFNSCSNDAYVFSLIDTYTSYYSGTVYINDETGETVYGGNPIFDLINRNAGNELFYRVWYSACYQLESTKEKKEEALSLLYSADLCTPLYNYNLSSDSDPVASLLLKLEKNLFNEWNIKSNVLGATTNTLGNMLLYPIDSVTESVIRSVSSMVAQFSIDVTSGATESFLDFGPNMDLFMSYFGKESGTSLPSGETIIDLNLMFPIIGYVIASCILIYFLVTAPFSKQSVIGLLIRFSCVLMAIYMSEPIIQVVYDLALKGWNVMFSSFDLETTYIPQLVSKLVTINYLNVSWTIDFIGTLFNIAVGWIIIKNAISLFIEVIERYVVSCFLYFGFGTAVSTLTSQNTQPIFFAYFKMVVTQLLLLFFNAYFIKGFFMLLVNYDKWAYSIYGIIFALAYLKTAQKIDSHLNSMGLSAAQTGGALTASVVGIGATMLSGAYMTAKVAKGVGKLANSTGKAGVKGVGHIEAAVGAKNGNYDMFSKGKKHQEGKLFGPSKDTPQNRAEFTDKVAKNAQKNMDKGKTAAYKAGMSGSALAKNMNDSLRMRGVNPASSFKSGLSKDTLSRLGNISDANFTNNGTQFSAQNTSIGGKNHAITGQVSHSSSHGGRYIGTDSEGKALYASISGKPTAKLGDSFPINVSKDQNGYTMSSAEMMTGVDLSRAPGLQERLANSEGAVLHCQAGKYGDMFTITDRDNNLIGGFDRNNNYYSADKAININEKDFSPDGKYGALGYSDVWCYSSELDAQLNGNSSLSPEDLHERASQSLGSIAESIANNKEELADTLREIADLNEDINNNSSDASFNLEEAEEKLNDLKAKESSLKESIDTETDYYNSVEKFQETLDAIAEYGGKDTFCGIRDGQIEIYKMENVTVYDAANGNTKNSIGSVNFIPLGSIDSKNLGL